MDFLRDYQFVVYVLVFGALFAWVFRRVGLIDVVGYVVGGVVLGLLVHSLGLRTSDAIQSIDVVSWIGIVLFSFRVGTSIGLRSLLAHSNRLLATELVVLVVQWISSFVLASLLGLDTAARMALFLFLVNSSTMALLALEKLNVVVGQDVKSVIYVQTQLEDLVQFILFSMFMVSGLGGLNPLNILVQTVKVAGTALLMIYSSKYVLKILSRSPLMTVRENKFFTSIAVALLFTSIATLIDLPPLFGAFIAGVVFSLFANVDDIGDRLDGLKDLGLLFYFSSLGFRLCLGMVGLPDAEAILMSGIAIGLLSFISRSIGLFLGSVLSGHGLELCLLISLLLTPLSESGIMFIDALARHGIVAPQVMHMLMVSFLTSLTTFSAVAPRIALGVPAVARLLPKRLVRAVNSISYSYTKRVSAFTSALSKVVIFASAVLAVSYADTIVKTVVEMLSLPLLVSAISTVVSTTVILVLFVVTIKGVLMALLTGFGSQSRYGVVEKLFDAVVGGLAIALQALILHEFISRHPVTEPISIAVVISVLVTMAITFRDTIAYLRGVKQLKPG